MIPSFSLLNFDIGVEMGMRFHMMYDVKKLPLEAFLLIYILLQNGEIATTAN